MLRNREVIEAFVNMRESSNVNLHSDGKKLFSYNTIIAQWTDDYEIKINKTKYSHTTSRHLNLLRYELKESGLYEIEEVDDIPINTQSL